MSFNLKDFFAGIVYLFVIFLPGATFLLLLVCVFPSILDSSLFGLLEISGKAGMALVLFGLSYFVGHLISLFCSSLEDAAWKVKPIRDRRKALDTVSAEMRGLVKLLLSEEVGLFKIDSKGDNLRSWCRIILRRNAGPLDVDVERKDADRRFFRNIVLVLALGTALFFWRYLGPEEVAKLPSGIAAGEYLVGAAVLFVLTLVSYLRYEDQDGKYTKLLFTSYLASCANALAPSQDFITHAGAVVYQRERKAAARYLIIRPGNHRDEWVLPKGHIETNESPTTAVIREIKEEVGVVVSEKMTFADLSRFQSGNEVVTVVYYVAEFKGKTDSLESRECRWESLDSARKLLSYPESRMALEKAASLVKKLEKQG